MTISLPEDLERFIRSEIQRGRFASEEEAVTEAVRWFRQWKQETGPAPSKALTEHGFKQQLLDCGLMTRLPTPAEPGAEEEFPPVVIEGEPLSETIIRERR